MINDILAFWNGGYVNEWRYLLAIPGSIWIGFLMGHAKCREKEKEAKLANSNTVKPVYLEDMWSEYS